MGEEVIYSLWIGFCFFVCGFCFVLSHTSPMLSRAREAHSQADGLSKIAYCLMQHQREAHVGGGGACWCGAGGPGGYNLNCNVGSSSIFRLAARQGHKG